MARVALVTGGSRGIGAAISIGLKNAGYQVAASYAGNEATAAEFSAETGIKTYKWDVADYDACAAGIAQVEADLGPVEILVNNAGITRDAPFHKMTRDQWQQVIDTNLSGVFNMTHPIWPGMRERKFGRIITISSINGQKGQFASVWCIQYDPPDLARYARTQIRQDHYDQFDQWPKRPVCPGKLCCLKSRRFGYHQVTGP